MSEIANKIKYNKHIKRKNNDIVAAMYAMYRTGKSLDAIGKVYRKTRQAIYDVFRSRGYELRSKPLAGLMIYDGIQFTLFKKYLRGTHPTRGRILLHYLVWEKSFGPVTKEFCIHHIDNNPTNNDIENLELVLRREMGIRFGKGSNQYSKKLSTCASK